MRPQSRYRTNRKRKQLTKQRGDEKERLKDDKKRCHHPAPCAPCCVPPRCSVLNRTDSGLCSRPRPAAPALLGWTAAHSSSLGAPPLTIPPYASSCILVQSHPYASLCIHILVHPCASFITDALPVVAGWGTRPRARTRGTSTARRLPR